MISKILNILLANINSNEADRKNKVACLYLNMMNIFGMVSMLAVFVTMLIEQESLSTNLGSALFKVFSVGILLISILYGVLYFVTKRAPFRTVAVCGLALSVLAVSLLMFIFDELVFVLVFSLVVPIYTVICMKTGAALIFNVVSLAVWGVIRICFGEIKFITMAFFVVATLLVFLLVSICAEYCDMLLSQGENKVEELNGHIEKKREFISKLSHRIRTPLSNILGITNILGENNDASKKHLIDSLRASVNTITDIVEMIDEESMVEPAKRESVSDEEEITTFDLQQLITQTGEVTKNLEVKLEAYGQLPLLRGRAQKLRRIFISIFNFFLHHTPKEQLPANISIVVNRVRIPINPIKYRFDIKSNITLEEPENESDMPDLKIAQRQIEALNGNIKRRFEEDMTCIYFNVCFDGEEAVAATAAPVSSTPVVSNETSGFTNTVRQKNLSQVDVIVCDDNPINQKVMSLSLDKYVKSITLASNGQECVDILQKNQYDIVLMDIQMPVLDGYGATQKIRSHEMTTGKHIPIIAVTANTLAGDRQHCLSVGMDAYVSKPFQLDDVLEKMRDLVTKYPQG